MDISEIIKRTIADSPLDEKRHYIGASSIGNKCDRAIWYGFKGAESSKPSPSLKTTFDIGKRLESLLLDYMDEAGLNVVRPTPENNYLFLQDTEVPLFQGHCDAILIMKDQAPAIVEIKTANTASFSNFKSKGLLVWRENYYAQIQAYLGMKGYSRGVLLAIDKNTSELHHEWVVYDDIYYHQLRYKARAIAQCSEPPEKLNKNPIFYACNVCAYRRTCHVD
jgi:hypothetical protein